MSSPAGLQPKLFVKHEDELRGAQRILMPIAGSRPPRESGRIASPMADQFTVGSDHHLSHALPRCGLTVTSLIPRSNAICLFEAPTPHLMQNLALAQRQRLEARNVTLTMRDSPRRAVSMAMPLLIALTAGGKILRDVLQDVRVIPLSILS